MDDGLLSSIAFIFYMLIGLSKDMTPYELGTVCHIFKFPE